MNMVSELKLTVLFACIIGLVLMVFISLKNLRDISSTQTDTTQKRQRVASSKPPADEAKYLPKNLKMIVKPEVDVGASGAKQHKKRSDLQKFNALLTTQRYSCQRIGVWGRPGERPKDGEKHLCLDENIKPRKDNCIVYSFGVGNQYTFDTYAADYGCEVYAFDPFKEGSTWLDKPRIHFYKIGIGSKTEFQMHRGKYKNITAYMMTYGDIVKMLGHENRMIDILKMDIERDEWKALPQMLKNGAFDDVKQLLIEFHYTAPECITTVKALHKYGLANFNTEYNVFYPKNIGLLEVSYVNTNLF